MKKLSVRKPSGIEMEINDTPDTRELMKLKGWVEVKEEVQEDLPLEPKPKSKSKPKKNDKQNKLDNKDQ